MEFNFNNLQFGTNTQPLTDQSTTPSVQNTFVPISMDSFKFGNIGNQPTTLPQIFTGEAAQPQKKEEEKKVIEDKKDREEVIELALDSINIKGAYKLDPIKHKKYIDVLKGMGVEEMPEYNEAYFEKFKTNFKTLVKDMDNIDDLIAVLKPFCEKLGISWDKIYNSKQFNFNDIARFFGSVVDNLCSDADNSECEMDHYSDED